MSTHRSLVLAATFSVVPWLVGCNGGGRGATSGATNGVGGNGSTTSSGGTTGDSSTTGSTHFNPGGSTSSGGTTGDPNCGVQNFTLQHGSIPEMVMVQDRSGSMVENPDGSGGGGFGGSSNPKGASTSKWNQVVPAIEQVVMTETTIQWGLVMFPEVGHDDDATFGCTVGTSLDVPFGANTGPMIKTALDNASPGGLTPTANGVTTAYNALTNMVDNDGHPKYILLATDGEPTCSADAAMNGNPATDAETAIMNAASGGVHVFVVGVGDSSGDDAELTKMANLGMEPNQTAGQKPYYQVSTTSDLVNVFTMLAGQIVSCSYALSTPPMSPDLVTIQSDGKTVTHDTTHTNGWDYGPMDMSIVFYGSACMDLQNGVVQSVAAVYGCPPVS